MFKLSDHARMPPRPPFHGTIGGRPVRYSPTEGWWLVKGKWMWIHPADVAKDASVLTESYYKDMYPKLPALPPEAFKKNG
jgi:hypothetical protein